MTVRYPLPQVTITQLEYLAAVAAADTWAQAAAEVGVTPSALSQGLAELERRIGLRLFGRVGRRRTLLDEADPVVEFAHRVLADAADLARWVSATREGRVGTLRVGMIDVVAIHHSAEVLRSFRRTNPDVDVRLSVAPSAQLLGAVISSQLDLAVIVRPEVMPESVDVAPLLDESLLVYGPKSAVGSPPEAWGPWVGFPQGSHTRRVTADALTALGASTEVVAESHQPDVLREMVHLDMGWTVLPPSQAETGLRPLTRVTSRPLAERELVVCRRASVAPNPAAGELRRALLAGSFEAQG